MNRRELVLSLAGVGVAGSTFTATGAFSQATAERSSTIEVVTDATGGVGLIPGSRVDSAYLDSDGVFGIDVARGDNEGFNRRSEYWLGGRVDQPDRLTIEDLEAGDVAFSDLDYPLFTVRNQSTDPRAVEVDFELGPVPEDVCLFVLTWSPDVGHGPTVAKIEPGDSLANTWRLPMAPADRFHVALVFDVGADPDPGGMDGSLSIVARRLDGGA